MRLFAPKETDVQEEEKSQRKRDKKREEPKDPYRWLTFVILLVVVFISYLFWADK